MKHLLIALPLLLFSCGEKLSESETVRINIVDSAEKFLRSTAKDAGETFTIDTTIVEKIDSISLKEAMESKMAFYSQDFAYKDETAKNLEDLVSLGKGIYTGDVARINQEKATAARNEANAVIYSYNDLVEKMKKMDSTNFEYYKSNITFHLIENNALKKFTVPLIMTKKFVVVQPKDL